MSGSARIVTTSRTRTGKTRRATARASARADGEQDFLAEGLLELFEVQRRLALVAQHFEPLLLRSTRPVFAVLSARVGSISDNRLGGWYSYRASKAALNQIVRTAAIELQRTRPAAFCVAIHPGTVDTRLSSPFAKSGLEIQTPATAAQRLIKVLDTLDAGSTGGFIDQHGRSIGW